MNRIDLEKLINKPRAFRHHTMATEIPPRLTMILLGSEVFSNRETPRNYKKFRDLRKSFIANI